MLLVERHLIQWSDALYQRCDNLSFLAKNIYNCANYIYRQNFFAKKNPDFGAVYHQIKNSLDSKAMPAKVCQMDYYLHCTSKAIIAELVRNKILKLIRGWNRGFKDLINMGKINNQKFVNIPHKKLIKQLKYTGLLAGIEVIEMEESYRSKCCALNLEPIIQYDNYLGKRIKSGLSKTNEEKLINADLNGSLNIGTQVTGNDFLVTSRSVCVVQPVRSRPDKLKI